MATTRPGVAYLTGSVRAELVAEGRQHEIALVVANDADRSSFSVVTAGGLTTVRGNDLKVTHEWRLESEPPPLFDGWGCHGTFPAGGLALLSTPDQVRLLDGNGSVRWAFEHDSWAGYGRGCSWFDERGQPYAVVPDSTRTGCTIVQLDPDSGAILAKGAVRPDEPAGMTPLHQSGGWVGVSESEGENAAHAWFVRPSQSHPGTPEVHVVDAGWNDEHLTDIDQSGSRVLTTGLNSGRITIRSFPSLDIVRELDIPEEELPLGASFVGSHLVTRLYHRQATIAIDSANRVHELEADDGWLVPGPNDSWLSVTRSGLRRWILNRT